MKHFIFIFILVFTSCHVHYHIDRASEIRVKTTTDNPVSNGCGVVGCMALHGSTPHPFIPYGPSSIDPEWYRPNFYTHPGRDIKGGDDIKIQQDTVVGTVTVISSEQYDSISPNIILIHAATELTNKQKDFFKNLKPNQ